MLGDALLWIEHVVILYGVMGLLGEVARTSVVVQCSVVFACAAR